jgi:hypothetical protein
LDGIAVIVWKSCWMRPDRKARRRISIAWLIFLGSYGCGGCKNRESKLRRRRQKGMGDDQWDGSLWSSVGAWAMISHSRMCWNTW